MVGHLEERDDERLHLHLCFLVGGCEEPAISLDCDLFDFVVGVVESVLENCEEIVASFVKYMGGVVEEGV